MSTSVEQVGRERAEDFRRTHNLGQQPLGDLITLIEQTIGADVAVVDAPADEHGMSMRHRDRGTVFIVVARTDRPMRQRSTLAHELGHVDAGDWRDDIGVAADRTSEGRADTFARHLLLPLEGATEAIDSAVDRDPPALLSRVVQRYLVSPQIAAIALEQLRVIDHETKERFMRLTTPRLAARYGWSDRYHALQAESRQLRAPRRLLTKAVTGYVENLVTIQQLAALRGIPVAELEAEYRAADIVPRAGTPSWIAPEDLPEISLDLSDLDAELAAGDG
ncbi:ImmA/IrrE family metallo-endopeptidase [Nocardia takedensis]